MYNKPRFWLTIGSIIILPFLFYHLLINGADYYYQWIELPAVRQEAKRVQGMIFQGIRDFGAPGEPTIEIILAIPNKGVIALYHPTRKSFTGGGPLVVSGIGDCVKTPFIPVSQGTSQITGLNLNSVTEIIDYYDDIYRSMEEHGYCVWRNAQGPLPTSP